MPSQVHINKNPYENMPVGGDKDLFEKNNRFGMTLSQARYTYAKQLANKDAWHGGDLKKIMDSRSRYSAVKPSTSYEYLINDTGEDIPGLRNYKDLGFPEARPLADQFGGQYDLDPIKAIIDQFNTGTTAKNSFAADAAAEAAATEAAATEAAATEAAAANTPSYLTQDDLSKWWEGVDKSAWGQQKSKPKGMGDFMKMMMFMSMMNPQGGGGYSGGGGLNNLSQLVSAFGQMNGSNTTT